MKIFFWITISLSAFIIQCGTFTASDSQSLTPQICKEALRDGSVVYSDRVKTLSLGELLALQKCGLAIHPNYQLSTEIAAQDEYSVPKIQQLLDSDPDEFYHLQLVRDLTALRSSERHRERAKNDCHLIMMSIKISASKMKNQNVKKLAQKELATLAAFYGEE